jgi:hypothetical protein
MLKGVQPNEVSFLISDSLLLTDFINLFGSSKNFGQLCAVRIPNRL